MTSGASEKHTFDILVNAKHALESLNFPEAIRLFDEALIQFPNNPDVLTAKASAHANMGQVDTAIQTLETALRADPHWQPALDIFNQLVQFSNLRRSSLVTLPGTQSASNASTEEAGWKIKDARLYGESGLIITSDKIIIEESANDRNIEPALAQVIRGHDLERSCTRRSGSFASLYGVWSGNFFHWMLEWLPRAVILEAAGFTGTYLVPPALFAKSSLILLGIDASRIEIANGQNLEVEELWVSRDCAAHHHEKYPELLKRIRSAFLSSDLVRQAPSRGKHIYLARNNPKRPRSVINEAELFSLLKGYDFTILDLEALPLHEQIGALRDAEVIITPHGAAMVHTLFTKPEALVLELFAPIYINPCTMPISRILNHRHFLVPSYRNFGPYPHLQDIEAFISFIKLTLDREIGSRS